MTDAEVRARAEAAIRALDAIAGMTDASDTDDAWAGWRHRRGPAFGPEAVPLMRLVFLDSGPLGRWPTPGEAPGRPVPRWVAGLSSAGVRVFVPEIADYEVRRKLLHARGDGGRPASRPAQGRLDYAPITTDVMLRAAELWADLRRSGLPTAAPGFARRGLHPGRPGPDGRRSGRRADGGHGQRRAPRPDVDARTWESIVS